MNEDRFAPLSVTDASGRQISLLNTDKPQPSTITAATMTMTMTTTSSSSSSPAIVLPMQSSPTQSYSSDEEARPVSSHQDKTTLQDQSKRKYHCTEPGCNKSFTTSGHLARHNRIHTGEKNFPCLFPGCQSRFSRQDNMMQHYRTHMSPKSRRSQKRSAAEEPRPRPRLHAHHRIRSDSVGHEPPLTIDQHLSNYHRSLHASASSSAQYHPPSRYKFREPLGVMVQNKRSTSASSIHQLVTPTSHSSTPETDPMSPPASTDLQPSAPLSPSFSSPCPADIFFQHRPLTYSSTAQRPSTTLLCPSTTLPTPMATSQLSIGSPVSDPLSSTTITTTTASSETTSEDAGRDKEKEGSGLLQLAHVVSTFG